MWCFVGAAGVAAVDQAIKAVVLVARPEFVVIPGFVAIRFATNTGAAFSLFRDFPGVLTAFGVLALVGLSAYVYRQRAAATWVDRVAFSLVLGGIAGNVIDRVRLGYVVDYVDVFIGDSHWPTFNLADSSLMIGLGLHVLTAWRQAGREARVPSPGAGQ